jgi:hypothetical protein
MKKIVFASFFIILTSYLIFCQGKITIISGNNNLSMIKDEKNFYLLPTFNNTQIFKVSIDEFVSIKKINVWRLTKDGLISEYMKEIKNKTKNKFWKITLIENMSQAKNGYVILLNYDYDNPVPSVGSNGQATGSVYKYGQNNPIFVFKINHFLLTYWDVKINFSAMGPLFVEDIKNKLLDPINKNQLDKKK